VKTVYMIADSRITTFPIKSLIYAGKNTQYDVVI
jgi:hypothetical protein